MRRILHTLAIMGTLWVSAADAWACPFCSSVSQTFTEEITAMDSVVVATLVKLPKNLGSEIGPGDEVPKAVFQVKKVIKGESYVRPQDRLETIYLGSAKPGTQFLVMGVDPPKLMWSTPMQLSQAAEHYIQQLLKLPKQGAQRLAFVQKYLEHKEEVLARDAYDEFAKSAFEDVIALKKEMDHDQLVKWIQDADIPANRRRLYFTMLSVCGNPDDLPMLEEYMQSSDRQKKAGLDAMIACYLTLKGPAGMSLVEELFLKNKSAEYADTYAAIMAIRFHGNQADVIPRERLLKGLHHMLQRPKLADLIIPDLADWDDWSQTDRLVELFKDADEKSSWVRVPVINYLRKCPEPRAKKLIAELEKIDPGAVKRANTFFPITPGKSEGGDGTASDAKAAAKGSS